MTPFGIDKLDYRGRAWEAVLPLPQADVDTEMEIFGIGVVIQI